MSTPNPQITDAAREAAIKEQSITFENMGTPLGHFVQQLLDAEREKWEKERQDKDWTASLCDRVNEFLREHRVYNEVKSGEQCSIAITYLHGHAGSLRVERDQLRQQLTEAKEQLDYAGVHTCSSQCSRPMCVMRRQLLAAQADCAMKDEAFEKLQSAYFGQNDRGHRIFDRDALEIITQALSPNCGEPLLQLVREMLAALKRIAAMKPHTHEANGGCASIAEAVVTKASQLGF